MGTLDKLINAMRLNDDDEEMFYDNDYIGDDEVEEAPAPRKSQTNKSQEAQPHEERPQKKAMPQNKVTPMRQAPAKRNNGNGMEVCVIRPTSVEDGREITETLLSNRTVVLNLEGLDVDIAQRIIDFTSGSCYAISGNLQKISHYIFIITPASVDVSGDFQDLLGGAFDNPMNNSI